MAVTGEEEGFHPFGVSSVHLAYAILGGYVCVFSLVSLFVKEKLYIGEATVATIVGIIFGPVALNLFNPFTWGNTDQITLELSRIVLIVQVFAVGVELPKAYMYRHWRSLFILLVPVMTFGWIVSSAFIYWLIPALNFVESLCVGACVTATDPVLASSVVGKGKFAKRVPGHLRNILSAESGSNDGMAFPFLYLGLYIILDQYNAGRAIKDFILITVLYEVVMGTVLGAVIGVVWRKAIKYAERKRLVDRESFLSFYFVLAIFCTGAGTLLGTDDLLVSFACGCAFAWDGWFTKKTEESHVSNVIDLLFNLSFFVYYGSIIPWDMMNAPELTIVPWRLVAIAILILVFRRIPIILALKPIIPDIRTWREALFCGHFGPIGVGAIFISILARAELETGHSVPLQNLPTDPNSPNYTVILAIWPIVSFLILSSIIVHGSSIAVFTLGKRLNTLSFTITYTQDNGTTQASAHSGASWAARLPRMSVVSRKGLAKGKRGKIGPISAPQDGRPLNSDFLREGGPISLSAIGRRDVNVDTAPEAARRREQRRHEVEDVRAMDGETEKDGERAEGEETEADFEEKINQGHEAWREGDSIIIEDEEGEIIRTISSPQEHHVRMAAEKFGQAAIDKVGSMEDDVKDEAEGIKGKLKRMWSGSGKKETNEKEGRRRSLDLEQGIPEDDEDSNVVEKRSSAGSYKPTPKSSPPKPPSGPAFVVDEDNRRTGHVNDRTQRRAIEEREEETAVERRRREAVLGPSQDSEDEDQGPPHPFYPAVSRSKGKEPESSSDDDDDEEDPIPSSRSQSSSDRAESSGSGAQLVQQPPPARTRGIRFGDISVGQESFSLAEGPPSTGARHHKTGSGDWRVRWRSDNK